MNATIYPDPFAGRPELSLAKLLLQTNDYDIGYKYNLPFEVDKEKLVSVSATSMYVYTKMNILDLNLGFRCPNLTADNGRQSIR